MEARSSQSHPRAYADRVTPVVAVKVKLVFKLLYIFYILSFDFMKEHCIIQLNLDKIVRV